MNIPTNHTFEYTRKSCNVYEYTKWIYQEITHLNLPGNHTTYEYTKTSHIWICQEITQHMIIPRNHTFECTKKSHIWIYQEITTYEYTKKSHIWIYQEITHLNIPGNHRTYEYTKKSHIWIYQEITEHMNIPRNHTFEYTRKSQNSGGSRNVGLGFKLAEGGLICAVCLIFPEIPYDNEII